MSTVNVNPTSNTITVIDNGTQIVTVNTQGPQGPAGADGEPGASGSQGPSGSTDVPTGTVSGSTQISLLGFVTSSATASFVVNSQTSSMSVLSSSYALTASHALNSGGGGSGDGFPFTGSAAISGTLSIEGPAGHITASGNISSSGTIIGKTGSFDEISVSQYIRHIGDTNTFIQFTDNRIQLQAGGIPFIGVHKDAAEPYPLTVNNGGNRINFRVQDRNSDLLLKTNSEEFWAGLYFAGSQKLVTAVDGINVIGNISSSGHITSSGNISASGNITAVSMSGDGSGLTGVTATLPAGVVSSSLQFGNTDDVTFRNITASNNIKGSDLLLTGGDIDLQNDGAQSNIKFYCESSNAHYTQLQAASHSEYSGNPIATLPAYDFDFAAPNFQGSITASSNISSSGTLFVNQIDMHDSQNTQINMYKDGSLNTSLNSRGNINSFIEASGSAANLGVGTNVPTEKLTVEGNISGSGFIQAAGTANSVGVIISASNSEGDSRDAQMIVPEHGFEIKNASFNNIFKIAGDNVGINTQYPSDSDYALRVSGSSGGTKAIEAIGDISSSGTVTALTGSFSHLEGNSPITVGDSITFQQPITSSIISASIISASRFSGDGSGLANVPESTDIDVYLNFEEVRSYAYIVPYNLQFAGFTTSSAMIVQISSSGAPYVFTSSLSQFSTLSITSSAAGLVTLSGSRL